MNAGLLEDFATHSFFDGFSWFDESCNARASPIRPSNSTNEQYVILSLNKHNDRGINSWIIALVAGFAFASTTSFY
tara:strand:+ start:125 stop:352 length:228 start_codon:yes stop_codon:yes gene_type:complete